ncbi:MAG TPA: class I SAM-dependent methyltransferase [Steroidobacteraceae bacterium]|nr:class I SAM-dependent methyltransferase [Steroidobacteraceae bacterium]
MNWRMKARIQNAVARLPESVSYPAYYWIQRRFGGLRRVDPLKGFRKFLNAAERLERVGASPVGAEFLEVGTGRQVNTPLAAWLCGARGITTVDLNPYLKEELVRDCVASIARRAEEVRGLLGKRLHPGRLEALLDLAGRPWRFGELLELCAIRYRAPADAGRLDIPDGSHDFHVSFNVFEHVSPAALGAILREGNRVLRESGLFVHRVDYSDHFSHKDPSISPVNFLQYSAEEWQRIAGNRFMYMNRLRVDDFMELFREAGHDIVLVDSDVSASVEALLDRGDLVLDAGFRQKSRQVLATTGSWFVTRRGRAQWQSGGGMS